MTEIQYAVAKKVYGKDIRAVRGKLQLTQAEFACLVNVSVKTIERWETGDKAVTGPIVTLLNLLGEYPQIEEAMKVPQKEYPLRLWYYCGNYVSTLIDVDERERKVKIRNYTGDFLKRAFGREENPDFEAYEQFLESRCFPRSRDKMKLMLEELDIPFYDPFLIIEKTQGRMAEDNCWIRIER